MSQTVRIDEATHAALRELAEADEITLQEALARVVEAYRRHRFFTQMAEGYAALTSDERADDARETALWDSTLNDGIENK